MLIWQMAIAGRKMQNTFGLRIYYAVSPAAASLALAASCSVLFMGMFDGPFESLLTQLPMQLFFFSFFNALYHR